MVHIVLVEPEIPQNCGKYRPHLCRHRLRPAPDPPSGLRHLRPGGEAGRPGLLAPGPCIRLRKPGGFLPAAPGGGGGPVAGHHQGPAGLLPGPVPGGVLAVLRQGDGGLPEAFRTAHYDRCIRLPMVSPARSLNLSNSVAVLTYEALRQKGFPASLAPAKWPIDLRIIFIKERTDMNYNKKPSWMWTWQGKKILLRCDFNVPQDKETRRDHQRQAHRGGTAHHPVSAGQRARRSSPAPTWASPRASGR